jgi:hypothetical protein
MPAEGLRQVQRLRLVGQHEARPEFGERALLARADAPGAHDEAADRAARRAQAFHCTHPPQAVSSTMPPKTMRYQAKTVKSWVET